MNDANRPIPEPLVTVDMLDRALVEMGYNEGLANCAVVAARLNELLAPRLAQAQREAAQAALEMAAKLVVDHYYHTPFPRSELPQRIRSLNPGTALELARVRAAQEEAKWWAVQVGFCVDADDPELPSLKQRLADLANRVSELERGLETTKP